MTTLTLASRSASRAEILERAGLAFAVSDSGVDEAPLKRRSLAKGLTPKEIAVLLADRKAVSVSQRSSGIVLGADQTLELAGALYDKVETVEDARDRLLMLRGRRHRLHSAVAVAMAGRVIWRVVQSADLAMREFSDAFLDQYLMAHGAAVLGSTGCYLLEQEGAQLFDEISGDYFAILGLPLLPVLDFLRSRGLAPT